MKSFKKLAGFKGFDGIAEFEKKFPLPKIEIDKDGKETKTIPAVIFERDVIIEQLDALKKDVETLKNQAQEGETQ